MTRRTSKHYVHFELNSETQVKIENFFSKLKIEHENKRTEILCDPDQLARKIVDKKVNSYKIKCLWCIISGI